MNALRQLALTCFGRRSIKDILAKDIYKAQRFLLEAQHNRDYFVKQCEFHEMRLKEMTTTLAQMNRSNT